MSDDTADKAAGKHIPAPPISVPDATPAPAAPPPADPPKARAPRAPKPAATVVAMGDEVAEDGAQWSDVTGPRGHIITISRGPPGGPVTTYEAVLAAGASDEQAASARANLRRRFLSN